MAAHQAPTPFDWGAFVAPLPTPTPLVLWDRLDANIRRMQDKALALGLALRPHIKTHKCKDIAFLQLAAGAAGLTVATVEEACAMLEGGVPSITVAYPHVQAVKLERLLALAVSRQAEVQLVVDSLPGVAAVTAAAQRHPRASDGQVDAESARWPVFIKVDVGLGRCGVAPESGQLLELARDITNDSHIKFAGILSHAGHAYGAADVAAVQAIGQDEVLKMALARTRLQEAGYSPPCISVGATPVCLAADEFPVAQELRPGNYVFLDFQALRLGLAALADPALWVLATVVSRNWKYCILDAGSKTLSSDSGPHGLAAGGEEYAPLHGLAFPLFPESPADSEGYPIVKLSEEHGFMVHHGVGPRVGDKVAILPAHACPVANLTDFLTVVHADGRLESWPVSARPGRFPID